MFTVLGQRSYPKQLYFGTSLRKEARRAPVTCYSQKQKLLDALLINLKHYTNPLLH